MPKFLQISKMHEAQLEQLTGSIAFNKSLSKVRIKIVEHIFARLKSFRALQGLFAWNSSRYGEILKAVSVLHNLNKQAALK